MIQGKEEGRSKYWRVSFGWSLQQIVLRVHLSAMQLPDGDTNTQQAGNENGLVGVGQSMNFDVVPQITAQNRSATLILESYTLARSQPCCVRLAPPSLSTGPCLLLWHLRVSEYVHDQH